MTVEKYYLTLKVENNSIIVRYAEYDNKNRKLSDHPTTDDGKVLYAQQANLAERIRERLRLPRDSLKLEGRVVNIPGPRRR